MQKKIKSKLSNHHYVADAAIVWCYDNRFWKSFGKLLEKEKLKHFDPIVIAGGAKSLASPAKKSEREFLLKQIELSIKLHRTPRVILMNHADCGAYGGLKTFGNDVEKEFSTHEKELGNAKKMIQKRFPKVRVDIIFVNFTGITFIK